MSLEDIKSDIKAIVAEKDCGPIFIRLSWHDAGVFSTGKLTGGKILRIFDRIHDHVITAQWDANTLPLSLYLAVTPRMITWWILRLYLRF